MKIERTMSAHLLEPWNPSFKMGTLSSGKDDLAQPVRGLRSSKA